MPTGPLAGSARRLVIGSFLLLCMGFGVRAREYALAAPSTSRAVPDWLFTVVVASCAAATAAVLLLLRRRVGDDDEAQQVMRFQPSRLSRLLALGALVVLAVALVAAARWVLAEGPTGEGKPGPLPAPSTPAGSGHSSGVTGHPLSSSGPPWIVVLVAVGLLAVLALVPLVRARRSGAVRESEASESTAAPTSADRQAFATGDSDTEREAVLAAYRTFERTAAQRGVSVLPPRTAAQISRHAVTLGVGDDAAVKELTTLFHRARYSLAPLDENSGQRAQELLDRLQHSERESS